MRGLHACSLCGYFPLLSHRDIVVDDRYTGRRATRLWKIAEMRPKLEPKFEEEGVAWERVREALEVAAEKAALASKAHLLDTAGISRMPVARVRLRMNEQRQMQACEEIHARKNLGSEWIALLTCGEERFFFAAGPGAVTSERAGANRPCH